VKPWVTDGGTSPCIDTGDPASTWTAELWPHGMQINMGAFGGTPEASMSSSTLGNVADVDGSSRVDYADVRFLADKWLKQQALLPEDLDRNGAVKFRRFCCLWKTVVVGRVTHEYEYKHSDSG